MYVGMYKYIYVLSLSPSIQATGSAPTYVCTYIHPPPRSVYPRAHHACPICWETYDALRGAVR